MRGMAGKASLLAGHRSMIEGYFLALLFMTIKTKSVHLLQFKLRTLGGMGVMACETFPLLKRGVFDIAARLQF